MLKGQQKAEDKNGWIYRLCFLVGMSSLLPWNAVLQGFDFFILRFQHYDPPFTFTLVLNGTNCVVQVLSVYFNAFCSINCRVSSSLILLTVLLVMIPLTSALLAEDVGFVLALIWVALMGVAMGILQTSLFGLVGLLPGKYTMALMTGLALSGVSIGTVRIITLAIWSNEQNETTSLISAGVYFAIAGIINIASLFAYHYIRNHEFTLSFMRQPLITEQFRSSEDYSPSQAYRPSETYRPSQAQIMSTGTLTIIPKKQRRHTLILTTLNKIKWLMLAVFFNFVITFLMFPGIILQGSSPTLSVAWFSVLTAYVVNWGDMIGRYVCNYFMMLGPKTVWIGIFLRLVFIFTILFAAAPNTSPNWLFHSDWFIFLNLFLFAVTNGHFASICMINGPNQVSNNHKEIAGMAMNMSLNIGILAGAVAAQSGMVKIQLSSL